MYVNNHDLLQINWIEYLFTEYLTIVFFFLNFEICMWLCFLTVKYLARIESAKLHRMCGFKKKINQNVSMEELCAPFKLISMSK